MPCQTQCAVSVSEVSGERVDTAETDGAIDKYEYACSFGTVSVVRDSYEDTARVDTHTSGGLPATRLDTWSDVSPASLVRVGGYLVGRTDGDEGLPSFHSYPLDTWEGDVSAGRDLGQPPCGSQSLDVDVDVWWHPIVSLGGCALVLKDEDPGSGLGVTRAWLLNPEAGVGTRVWTELPTSPKRLLGACSGVLGDTAYFPGFDDNGITMTTYHRERGWQQDITVRQPDWGVYGGDSLVAVGRFMVYIGCQVDKTVWEMRFKLIAYDTISGETEVWHELGQGIPVAEGSCSNPRLLHVSGNTAIITAYIPCGMALEVVFDESMIYPDHSMEYAYNVGRRGTPTE
ncbi:hypothetical protein KIPB_005608 [Kipferlia bialata]|uniref:Uncharacterized protein n=1 Tax=Kipferlia bialata TaxID=797122 RepID=A0A9K3GHI3_9EUKA|nr:hypothetical protein KIPB_003091 [Kipferlia bialata]GIQ84164.1 hypothetical protein KIPB_005608 [Kipferlia bialata]|eukprot:g3091.t1